MQYRISVGYPHYPHEKIYFLWIMGTIILPKQRNLNIRAVQSDIKVVFWDKWYYNKEYKKQRRKKDDSRSNKNNDNW